MPLFCQKLTPGQGKNFTKNQLDLFVRSFSDSLATPDGCLEHINLVSWLGPELKSSDWLIKIGRLTNQSSSESLSGTIESIGGQALERGLQIRLNSNA